MKLLDLESKLAVKENELLGLKKPNNVIERLKAEKLGKEIQELRDKIYEFSREKGLR